MQIMEKKAHLTGEIFTHRLLWHSAQSFHNAALEREEGADHQLLAAMLFIYLAFEAYLNDVGSRLCPDEWKKEREFFAQGPHRGTRGKLDHLLQRCNLKVFDSQVRPYSTIKKLTTRRHKLVHGHTESVNEVIEFDVQNPPTHVEPEVWTFAEPAFIEQAFLDVEQICDAIQKSAQLILGEPAIPSPKAFAGIMWHQGGSIES